MSVSTPSSTPRSVYTRWRRQFSTGGALLAALVVLDAWPATRAAHHVLEPATVLTAGSLTAGHLYATATAMLRKLREKVVIIDFRDDLKDPASDDRAG
jgi:hypothetical protein